MITGTRCIKYIYIKKKFTIVGLRNPSRYTSVPVRKAHNFLSHRWISLKISQEFPDAVFLGVDVESLLGEAVVSALHTSVPVRKGHNF